MRLNTPLLITFLIGSILTGLAILIASSEDILLIILALFTMFQGIVLINKAVKGITLRVSILENHLYAMFFTLSFIPPFIKKKSVKINIENIKEVLYYPDRFGYCLGVEFLASEDDNVGKRINTWEMNQRAKKDCPVYHFRHLDLYMGKLNKNDFNALWQINEIKPELNFNIPDYINKRFSDVLHKQIDPGGDTIFIERPSIIKSSLLWLIIILLFVSIGLFIGIDIKEKTEFLKGSLLILGPIIFSVAILFRYHYLRYSYHRITSNGISINDLLLAISGISIFPINININFDDIVWASPYLNRKDLNNKLKDYGLNRFSENVILIWSEGYFYIPRYQIIVIHRVNEMYRAIIFAASKNFHKLFWQQLDDRNIQHGFSYDKMPKSPMVPYYISIFFVFTIFLLVNWKTTDPSFYYLRGKAYLYLMFPNKAEEDLLIAEQLGFKGNKESDMYYMLGYCCEYKEDYDKAIEIYRKGNKALQNDDISYRISQIELKTIQEARKLYAEKRYNEALECFKRAVEIDPANHETLNERGLFFIDLHDYDKALEDYNQAISLCPHNYNYLVNRGYIYFVLNDFDKALIDYESALKLDTNSAIYSYIGDVLREMKEYKKSIEYYTKSIELCSTDDAVIYNSRGVCYAELKQHMKAFQDYNKAIEIDANYASPYNNRAIIYKEGGERNKALKDYIKAIELEPVEKIYYYNRALLYMDLQDKNLAIKDLKKAIEIDPNYVDAQEQLKTLE